MKVLLGVTGSVAAIRTPELYQALRRVGHEVKIVATQAALYFFDPAAIDYGMPNPECGIEEEKSSDIASSFRIPHSASRNREIVILDEDEWPGRDSGRRYERDDPVLHIELRRWAELLLIAPLDANTLAKLAFGLADNCLTCVWRAWDPTRPVILAPAMNTLMWEHPLTAQHLRQIAAGHAECGMRSAECRMQEEKSPANPFLFRIPQSELRAPLEAPGELDLERLMEWINQNCPKLRIVPPVSKRLACGDVGIGAMAAVSEIVHAVAEMAKSTTQEPRMQ